MEMTGWGNYPKLDCAVSAPRSETDLAALISRGHAIARGNGRSYGDSAISPHNTIDMRSFDRMIAFDPDTGSQVGKSK